MANKVAKESPHLRIRIDPKLLAKLEKAREKNGRTLTGEIVDRLEASYEQAERMSAFKEGMEARVEDLRLRLAESESWAEKQLEEANAESAKFQKQIVNLTAKVDEVRRSSEEAMHAVALIDVLLGNDKQKSELLRVFALELGRIPEDQMNSPDTARRLERVIAENVFASPETSA
jgi:chromosome segregation ATPase